mmetsp:Transcript_15366/g.60058  ORF Transcript_15366/g.60058 Transcript_15366/m.60058 type:complete len:211 (+) Transcript_15366:1052-1684(+)
MSSGCFANCRWLAIAAIRPEMPVWICSRGPTHSAGGTVVSGSAASTLKSSMLVSWHLSTALCRDLANSSSSVSSMVLSWKRGLRLTKVASTAAAKERMRSTAAWQCMRATLAMFPSSSMALASASYAAAKSERKATSASLAAAATFLSWSPAVLALRRCLSMARKPSKTAWRRACAFCRTSWIFLFICTTCCCSSFRDVARAFTNAALCS